MFGHLNNILKINKTKDLERGLLFYNYCFSRIELECFGSSAAILGAIYLSFVQGQLNAFSRNINR
ncbi:hypothetical protein ZONE111904_03025 [Zobellia nedashkovskayae]